MKYILVFALLSSSYLYGMEDLNNKTKKPELYRNYYEEAALGILGKYQTKPTNLNEKKELKKLPDNATPLQIVGFLKNLNNGDWHKVDVTITRSKL